MHLGAPNYMKQNLSELKGEITKLQHVDILKNAIFLVIDRTIGQNLL